MLFLVWSYDSNILRYICIFLDTTLEYLHFRLYATPKNFSYCPLVFFFLFILHYLSQLFVSHLSHFIIKRWTKKGDCTAQRRNIWKTSCFLHCQGVSRARIFSREHPVLWLLILYIFFLSNPPTPSYQLAK